MANEEQLAILRQGDGYVGRGRVGELTPWLRSCRMWLCDALEAQLQSAEDERGRLVESVLAWVGA